MFPADRKKHQINVASLVPPAVSLWLQAIHEWGSNAQLQSLQLLQGWRSAPVRDARRAYPGGNRLPAAAGCSAWRKGLVNYTRLNDSPQRIINTRGLPDVP